MFVPQEYDVYDNNNQYVTTFTMNVSDMCTYEGPGVRVIDAPSVSTYDAPRHLPTTQPLLQPLLSKLEAIPKQSGSTCVICAEQVRQIIMQPCGHYQCCASCIVRMIKSQPQQPLTCPSCRVSVNDVMRVFT